MSNSKRLAQMIAVSAVAGLFAGEVVHLATDLPHIVEWCVAGSIGYVAAEIYELWLDRRRST